MKTFLAAIAMTVLGMPVFAGGETASNPDARVYFVNLTDGDSVASPLTVVFGLPGMGVAPAGTEKDNTRLRGRSLRGERLQMDAPFGSWGTQTFIAGLTHTDLIAPWVIKGAMDGLAFAAYIREVPAPELNPGTVVILDNLATHRNAEATQALKEAGCWFLYLPPYSPDLNPIEQAFSKLKSHLRKAGARTFSELFNALGQICDLFSPQECWNYFKAAGYVSS